MIRRRFLNHFVARTLGGAVVVVREWQVVRELAGGEEVYEAPDLATDSGQTVRFDAASGGFALADGTVLTTDDPRADETRRRHGSQK